MMKYILLLATAIFVFAYPYAQINAQTEKPVDVIISYFRNVQTITTQNSVPTIVEFEVDNERIRDYLLIEPSSNQPQPFVIIESNEDIGYSVTSNHRINSENRYLSDNNSSSQIEYPLSEAGQNSVSLVLTYNQPVNSNSLTLDLAENATLPESVSISTLSPSQKLVVATKDLTSNKVSFPATTASRWRVNLTYSQPLVLNKISFDQVDSSENTSYLIRFLARPDETYRLYSEKVGSFRVPSTSESPNLRTENAQRINTPPLRPNPNFNNADLDNDGILDDRDNCTEAKNPNQEDKNNNNIGDACEDFDADGIKNFEDNCPEHPNRRQQDTDGDGIGDHCDEEESRLIEQLSFLPWLGIALGFSVVIYLFFKTAKAKTQDNTDKSDEKENNDKSSPTSSGSK